MKSLYSNFLKDSDPCDEVAQLFCDEYLNGSVPKYIFGLNDYAQSIARQIDVDGFIDDFTHEVEYLNKPIIRTANVPKNALVVSVVMGRPFVAENNLLKYGLRHLNYFSFERYASINVAPVKFWPEFKKDFILNLKMYEWISELLEDDESKKVLSKIIKFRLSQNLEHMRGFTDTQYRQYFEDFLELKSDGEVFVDVGSFDGLTSHEFIKRCPKYAAVHIFEPEPSNMVTTKSRLIGHDSIVFHSFGLSDSAKTIRFSSQGSSSRIAEHGDLEISVAPLDELLYQPFSFLKMDIEGGELAAIEGAKQGIVNHHPRLAISVYHRFDDLWKIPERILSYRDDYKIFLRHYTEGVDETVMFFMPRDLQS
jgi:FkbM family methyltransferase